MIQFKQNIYRTDCFRKAISLSLTFITMLSISVSVYASPIPLNSGHTLPIEAPAAILMDRNTGIIMYERNMHDRHYPASITKVMTALLVLEAYGDNLNARVPFSHDAVFSIPRHTSHIAMNDNETLSVLEALYALMLPSANEVANALAELVGGTMDDFVLMMTARAIELGAHNTNFMNAHGLHDPEHFTTAHDMALILREALKFPILHEIISTEFTEIPPTERQPLPRPLLNTNHMILSASQHFNPNVVGGKTGFTDEARHTLVTFGQLRNMELVAVVMRQERALTYLDTTTLLNFGFENFENVLVFDRNSYTREIPILGQTETVRAIGERTLTMSLPLGAREHITTTFDIPEFIEPPIYSGDMIGSATIMFNDTELSTIRIFAEMPTIFVPEVFVPQYLPEYFGRDVSPLGILLTIMQVLAVVVAAIGALILIIHYKNKRRRLRRFHATRSGQTYYYRYK
ncbi:MAG: D-alanyl-D-alanine carboxypeptidase [Defluviitaleaceae bacterium]|nr:D-alanyl-D-alanine carboxypeptidase [Defluviitaleaceae bacterium]